MEISIDYRLIDRGDRWEVYDVVFDNVSLVSNYRSQFNEIVRTQSYDALVQKLRSRNRIPVTGPEAWDANKGPAKMPMPWSSKAPSGVAAETRLRSVTMETNKGALGLMTVGAARSPSDAKAECRVPSRSI